MVVQIKEGIELSGALSLTLEIKMVSFTNILIEIIVYENVEYHLLH